MNTLFKVSFLFCFVLFGQMVFAQDEEYGLAIRYSDQLQGTKTSNGQSYDANQLTAAHKTLPFGTKIKVTNIDTKQSTVVRINDRGPFVKGHVVDLSSKAAAQIGIKEGGKARVKVVVAKSNTKSTVTATKPAKKAKPTPKVATIPKKKTTPSRSLSVAKESVRILKQGDKGYGVQVGYYASEENAMRYIESLKAKWFKSISLNIDDSSGSRRYKVIIGDYPTRAAADSYLTNVQKKDIKGFVVNMSKLNY